MKLNYISIRKIDKHYKDLQKQIIPGSHYKSFERIGIYPF
jgi:hypothetical protein